MEAKAELRRAIKERLARLTQNDRRVESQIIVREVRKLVPASARSIAVYSPYLDEPDITPLITELLGQKKVICMGKVEGNRMVMHRIRSLEDISRNPVTNIPEPAAHSPLENGAVDVAIIPGRAFTADCMRMGRGNGGYDIWLAAQKDDLLKIGVCFDCQLVQDVPLEPHDRQVDAVVTASKVYRR